MDATAIVILLAAGLATGVSAGLALARGLGRARSAAPTTGASADALVEARLAGLGDELRRLTTLVRELERERAESLGMLGAQIRATGEQTARLAETTSELREALASSKTRGQWGERMAEDVLRLAGLVENVNYRKQRALDSGGVPDYTFLLPNGLQLHMDVKFPLDNYLRWRNAGGQAEREAARTQFLRDVRTCVRGLAERGYAEPSTGVDCTLLFVPNEQLFAFIQEHDPALLDEALGRKVVLCSPMTLFAVLAVVRQAVEHFRLERTSNEVLVLLSAFQQQWGKYVEEFDRLGKQLDTVRRTYDDLGGPRRRQLERPLEQINHLRHERAVPEKVSR